MTNWDPESHKRLSDRVLESLSLALEQEDIDIAEILVNVLELSVTRNAGGPGFVERRDFSAEMEDALNRYETLKMKLKG